ncbi:MAG: hypothetical protein K0Q46_2537 [Rhodococcus erythropolis]|jgi:hypothetical protein|nr:hypothetical protein [Rhodococcus erythropolis]MDF2895751.1 hypothetical protein [Rhodococcus erythropolis]
MSEALDTWNRTDTAGIGSPREAYVSGWNAAVYAAQEELVKRDQFSERTLRILDGLLDKSNFSVSRTSADHAENLPVAETSSGQHRKVLLQAGDDLPVCDTCVNILGLNVRWDHAVQRHALMPNE